MKYFDEDEAARINAEPWQIDLLKRNPGYLGWGPHEDYMCGDGNGWNSRQLYPSWVDFGPWQLDDLNECVNFYFSVNRASKECGSCGGNGYHRDAQEVVNSFYSHMNPKGEHWNDKITEDEVKALLDANRLYDWTRKGITPTAEEVNAAQNQRGLMGHDGINRSILTRTRLERLGIPVECDECGGHGYTYTAHVAHVSLTLWWLHPRKGCSRGIEIERIEESEIPAVLEFLRTAAKRNADRFANLSENDPSVAQSHEKQS